MDEREELLGYGDSLMMNGRVAEALDVYWRCGAAVDPQRLGRLSRALVGAAAGAAAPRDAALGCPACRGPPLAPVTGPCGHTWCRPCAPAGRCPACRRAAPQPLADNVLVKAAVAKWWPLAAQADRLRHQAILLIAADLAEPAIAHLNAAIRVFPRDHLLVETRCEALSKLNRWHQAAADAELLTKLKPLWPKGYYRKAIAMARLGHYEDALLAFTLCVALDETYVQSVKHEVTKILQRLINPAMPCKMLFMRNPLTPWWSPNYMEDDATMASDILEDYNGTEKTSHPMLENRKLHHLLERISYEIENLKRLDPSMDDLELRSECIEASDFDCVLCCRTLWKPVTTPCGHTYCSSCLQRSLDYSSNCPLCMTPLTEYLTSGEKCVTQFLETALLVGLPVDYANRLMLDRAEVSSLAYSPDLPVFVCTTAFPTVSCPLFVFEPRYRLMIRRAVETGAGRFGMAACVKLPNGTKRYADYGTELEIRDWMLMNDGCSILSNVGMRRFRVTCRGERDGYDTARVEYFTDEPIPRSSLAEIATLHDQVMSSGRQWFNRMSADLKGEILRTFGDMPALERDWYKLRDGPAWAWWLVAILPLGPQLQVSILATTCLEKRLRAIDKTLRHLEEASSRVQPTGATLLRQHHLT